jgi:Bacterial Ig domain
MLQVVIDDTRGADGCYTCCCDTVALKPGETQPLHLKYAPWAAPIGQLHCEPLIEIELKETCPTGVGGDLAPQLVAKPCYNTGTNVHLDGNLRTVVSDPEGKDVKFRVMPLYGARHGKLLLHPSGAFSYDPSFNFQGTERFYVQASDQINAPLVFEVMIAVGIDSGTVVATPDFYVGQPVVNQPYYTVVIPLIATPSAKQCQVYRLNIRQGALDCECNCYWQVHCVDVRINKC